MKKELKAQLKGYVKVGTFGGWQWEVESVYNDIDTVTLYKKEDTENTNIGNYLCLVSSRREGSRDFIISPNTNYVPEFTDNKLISNLINSL